MYTLTLDDAQKTLAFITGGEYNNEIISLDSSLDKKPKKKLNMDKTAMLIENLYRSMGNKLSFNKMDQLREAIHAKKRPVNREIAQFYDHAMQLLDNGKDKEIVLVDGEVTPMFDTSMERSVFMVAGMSGSGKSTYTAQLCKTYHKQYPDNNIVLFSNKPEDPVFDRLSFVDRVVITDDLMKEPITLNELEKSLVIFDDVECTTSKEIDKELIRISDLILQQGRSYKTSFVYISHQSNNYKATRNILNEAHSVTIFPAMVTRYSLNYLLGKYFGFTKEEITKICKLPSRWVTIYKSPSVVLYRNGAYIVDC
tara:strand:+ start:1555 stop:2487 length:933 start_codon:yes stop_codon:yes gene_type:complete